MYCYIYQGLKYCMLVCTMPRGPQNNVPSESSFATKSALFGPKNVCPFQILDLTLALERHYTTPPENSVIRLHSNMTSIMPWFPQIMTYLFQGLFKDFWGTFSRSFQGLFLCSFKHLFAKKWSTMNFSNKTNRDHLILSSSEKWGGGGEIWVCVF